MRTLQFPDDFIWGTSTAAAQVETPSDHNWRGVKSKDGYVFDQTTQHELRRMEDLENIRQFGSMYRCGVDWARLQTAAYAPFEMDVVKEYQDFFQALLDADMQIMFVIHHFTNPLWFENKEGWLNNDNVGAFVDYANQCIKYFAPYVANWNTFNEPNVYTLNGYILGQFPPFKKNYFKANRAIGNMGKAHDIVYDMLKEKDGEKPVGISLNTGWFDGIGLGNIPASFVDWWFHKRTSRLFQRLDYWGISYYAYIPFRPMAITEIDNPGELAKLNIPHDKMWGYRPEGLGRIIHRIYKWYKKPIMITENGICTEDSDKRIQSLKDYLSICHELIAEGIPLKGYIHWCTWDNFEWNLGPTYRFGLVRVDFETMERTMTPAGEFYAKITKENKVDV